MELQEFKKHYVQQELGVTESFGKILSFVDFGNVNYWFEEDRQTDENIALKDDEKLIIDIVKLKNFLSIFSDDIRFYYGHDPVNGKSIWFIQKAEEIFSKNRVFSKPIQKIRHYLETDTEKDSNTRVLQHDDQGDFVYIPKCNFDVEISVDGIKTIEHYDTVCLLSSDADFLHLLRFLKKKGKKVILIKGGHVIHNLKKIADLVVNAQDIKKHITAIKQKPGIKPGLADRNPESTGRTTQKDRM
jgi:uncharacterized LabA/DUF88 family protein